MGISGDFSLRRREKRDAPELFQIFEQPLCKRAMVLEPFKSSEDVQTWFDAQPQGSLELVATIGGRTIGFVALQPCPGSQSHSGWVNLFIHDDFHGLGIGTLMMKAIVATGVILMGLTRLQLVVQADNERAIRLYRKFGFEIEGRHEAFSQRDGDYIAAYSMARLSKKLCIGPDNAMETSKIIRDLLYLYRSV
jgi:putative acetyltransferase